MDKVILCRSYVGDSRVEKMAFFLRDAFDTTIFYWSREGKIPEIKHDGIKRDYFVCRAPYYSLRIIPILLIWSAWLFWKLLRSEADVYHATDLDTAYPAMIAAKIRRKKFVYDIADLHRDIIPPSLPNWIKTFSWFLERTAINGADLVILPDERRLVQITGSKPKEIIYVYNVPEIPRKNEISIPHEIESFTKGRFSIAYFGSLNDQRFILEMARIVSGEENYCMLIGGLGPTEEEIRSLCAKFPDKLRYFGRMTYPEVLSASSACDLLFAIYDPFIPNNRFASPNKIFEAMALGKPVLVSKGTTMTDYIEKYGIGISVDYNSQETCVEALRLMAKKGVEYQAYAKQSAQSYAEFGSEKMKDTLISSYKKMSCDPR